MVINRQSGVVVVRAMPNELRDVADYLRKTQSTVTRQVVLEAKIVEVELNSGFQAGINWTPLVTKGNKTVVLRPERPARRLRWRSVRAAGQPRCRDRPAIPSIGQIVNSLGGAFTLASDFTDFNAFIELLDAQGRTRVLSSPRVSTLHNQKAIIKAGTDEFFVTGVSSNTTTGESTTTSLDVELTPFFSGVALDVTPQISDDGTVLLHIHPTVSEVTDQSKRISFGGATSDLPLALSQIRESDSIVRAHSGQVIVIGGLMRETRQRNDYKTPLLGDVPGLGNLFRSKRDLTSTVELVILLRPVVVDDGDWAAMVRRNARIASQRWRKKGELSRTSDERRSAARRSASASCCSSRRSSPRAAQPGAEPSRRRSGRKLGRVLTDLGLVQEQQLHDALARHLQIPFVDLRQLTLDQPTVRLLPEAHARRFRALVLQSDARGL